MTKATNTRTKKAYTWTDKDRLKAGFYKGYDIEWLRGIGEDHPDFYLVAEYDEMNENV